MCGLSNALALGLAIKGVNVQASKPVRRSGGGVWLVSTLVKRSWSDQGRRRQVRHQLLGQLEGVPVEALVRRAVDHAVILQNGQQLFEEGFGGLRLVRLDHVALAARTRARGSVEAPDYNNSSSSSRLDVELVGRSSTLHKVLLEVSPHLAVKMPRD